MAIFPALQKLTHICIEYMKSLIKISQKILSSTLIAKLKNIQMVGSLVQPTCLF